MDERKFLQEKERRRKILEEICCYLETRKKVFFLKMAESSVANAK
jgi:hypothetical protein